MANLILRTTVTSIASTISKVYHLMATFQRAMSERGFEILTQCRNRNELSKFVAWTKIGKRDHIDVFATKVANCSVVSIPA